jgi:hypothetical protein
MSSEPPKRFESELTVVIDRDKLPPKPEAAPASTVFGPTAMQLADIERARRDIEDAKDRPTMMTCPWCDDGLVTPEKRAEWLSRYAELAIPAADD